MRLAVAVGIGQPEFLVMAVGGRVCHAINVGQGFGMAEPAALPRGNTSATGCCRSKSAGTVKVPRRTKLMSWPPQ